ncbi:MAG: hypothetical protein KBD57_13530 [Bacteroidia bacterium]|nr:hypothetical protein [Bacteroidia bacterium]
MAIFRKVHIQFWSDVFIQSLTPEQKFFFLYLLTNEKTKQCGIYEITTRHISYDTGYNIETVNKLLEFFENSGKILFSRETNEIAVKNWEKYNGSKSPDVQKLVNKELVFIKNKRLPQWLQSPDTVLPLSKKLPREEPEEEPEENQMKKKELPKMTEKEFVDFSEKMKNDKLFIQPLFTAGVKPEYLDKWIIQFHIQIVGDDKINKDYNEYRKHFKNWLKKQDYYNKPPSLNSGQQFSKGKDASGGYDTGVHDSSIYDEMKKK